MVTRTCCSEDYQSEFNTKYNMAKLDELDFWKNNVSANITNFLNAYEKLIDFIPQYYTTITYDVEDAKKDYKYFRDKQTWMLN